MKTTPPPGRFSRNAHALIYHRFKEEQARWLQIWFDQKEEEPRALKGRKGKEQHNILQ